MDELNGQLGTRSGRGGSFVDGFNFYIKVFDSDDVMGNKEFA